MKWIKIDCNCGCEFMVAENEYYIEHYDEFEHDMFTCPLCDHGVYTDECEICEV